MFGCNIKAKQVIKRQIHNFVPVPHMSRTWASFDDVFSNVCSTIIKVSIKSSSSCRRFIASGWFGLVKVEIKPPGQVPLLLWLYSHLTN